jgi:hypothetical protein
MTTDAQSISYRPAIVHQDDIVQGDTCSFRVTLKDENDAAINLTGTTANMEIKRLDGSLVLALSIGDGITYTNAASGEMTITIDADDTAALDPEYTYSYDVQWTNGANIRTVAAGKLRIMKQITD